MKTNEVARDGETEPRAGFLRRATIEALEQLRQLLFRDPVAGVAHGDFDGVSSRDHFDRDSSAVVRELHGVRNQVFDRAAELLAIGRYARLLTTHLELDPPFTRDR